MLPQLLLALFAVASAQFCSNSPLSSTSLQSILADALTRLDTSSAQNWNPVHNNYARTGPSACLPPTFPHGVSKCGYPLAFAGPNTGSVVDYPNPDFNYSVPIVNQTKIIFRTDKGTYTDVAIQLREDEAVIWFGCTPGTHYWSHSQLQFSQGVVTLPSPVNLRRGVIGDSKNALRINVYASDPTSASNAATLIIYTQDTKTGKRISDAFAAAGFPTVGHNIENIPKSVATLGISPTGAFLHWAIRLSQLDQADTDAITAFSAAQFAFPYVRLTPHFAPNWFWPSVPIGPKINWNPDFQSALLVDTLRQSENTYEPFVMGVVNALLVNIKSVFAATTVPVAPGVTKTLKLVQGFPIRAAYIEDDGTKWQWESQFGEELSRDSLYYQFNPATAPTYDAYNPAAQSLGLNFTIALGVSPESPAWKVGLPPQTLPSQYTHASFWNLVWYNSSLLTAARTNLYDTSIRRVAGASGIAWKVPGSAPIDPLQVVWIRAFGDPAGISCQTLAAQLNLPCLSPGPNGLNRPNLQTWYRVYVNPNPQSGVYPSPNTILPPFLLHGFGGLV